MRLLFRRLTRSPEAVPGEPPFGSAARGREALLGGIGGRPIVLADSYPASAKQWHSAAQECCAYLLNYLTEGYSVSDSPGFGITGLAARSARPRPAHAAASRTITSRLAAALHSAPSPRPAAAETAIRSLSDFNNGPIIRTASGPPMYPTACGAMCPRNSSTRSRWGNAAGPPNRASGLGSAATVLPGASYRGGEPRARRAGVRSEFPTALRTAAPGRARGATRHRRGPARRFRPQSPSAREPPRQAAM